MKQRQLAPAEESQLQRRAWQAPSQRESSPDLRDALAVLRQRRWSILALTVLTVGLALAVSAQQVPMYRSEAAVLIRPVPTGDTAAPLVEPNLATEVEVLGSVAVAEVVAENLDSNETPRQLSADLDVSTPDETEILGISYTHPDPEEAQRRAQGFADGYLDYRRRTVTEALVVSAEEIQEELSILRERLQEVENRLARADQTDPRTSALQAEASLIQGMIVQRQLDQLRLTGRPTVGNVIEPATLESNPVSPNHALNGAFGLFAGLGLGIGLAFLRDRLAGRIRTQTELEATLGAPILGMIPQVSGWRRRKDAYLVAREDWHAPASEAYRILRTGLLSDAPSDEARSILVTSAGGGEGKSATAANLAVTLARAGKKVVVVSADLRRPRLHSFFGTDRGVGLSDVLTGRATLKQAVKALDQPARGDGSEQLRILTSGARPENPAELLGSPRMSSLLRELETEADFVILDAPPVLAVTDALVLASVTHATLLVIGPSSSTETSISAVRQQLNKVGAHIIGAVVNGPDPSMTQSSYTY